ncbi:BnaCnng14970D [Brassica napus]|uniref:BnaCnng14970D protein n=2 Tax=Brassica TaxID=3705 RepID=A0A078I8V6_BRANA|nr:BnaCnng14970D [Brassica napus]
MKKTQVLALALLRRKCRLVTGVVVGSHSFGLNWNRVEAFALQYEMHASSYQRDIATAQQVSKTSGAPAIGCLTVLPAAITTRPMVWHYDSDCGFNYKLYTISFFMWDYTDNQKGRWMTQAEAYTAVEEYEAIGNQVKRA